MNKRIILIGSVILLILAAVVYVIGRVNQNGSKLDILVAPHTATLKLDGKGIKPGTHKVSLGTHKIEALKDGFITQNKTIKVAKSPQFIGFILEPNSPQTANWYKNHPEDFNLTQSINNQLFDQTGSQALKSNPLLKQLPYIGPALTFRIDYGVPSKDSKTGQPAIYIRYRTENDKQAALKWIKDQSVDINSLDIVYIPGDF